MSFKNAKIIATGIDAESYHKQDSPRGDKSFVMSSSAIRAVFEKCPRAWINGWERPESASLDYGNLIDTLVLTPQLFADRYVTRPETYTDEKGNEKPWHHASKTCQAWLAQNEGKTILSVKEAGHAMKARDRLLGDQQIKSLLDASDKQVWITGEWHDESGIVVPVQCLIDFAERFVPLTRLRIGDLKTTKNAAPMAWAKWARFVGYDLQAAWNLDLFNAATGEQRRDFAFILSESEPPYEVGRRYCTVDEMDGERDERSALMSGRRQYTRLMKNYCLCLKHNFWPSYDDSDESVNGWTVLATDPNEEQKRMFSPKFEFPNESTEDEPIGDDLKL